MDRRTALAAHQVLGVITTLGFMVYYGIAAAVTIRVSAFKGQGNWLDIRRASFAGLHLIMGAAVIFVLFILAFHKNMGYLFTPEHDVVAMVALLSWSVILYQFGDGLPNTVCQCITWHCRCEVYGLPGFLLSFRTGFADRIHLRIHLRLGSNWYLVWLPCKSDNLRHIIMEKI